MSMKRALLTDIAARPIRNRLIAPKGTAFETYGNGQLSLATGVTHAPGDTTTAIRVTHTTASNSGSAFPMPAGEFIVGQQRVAIGCWVYRESGAEFENIGVAIRSVTSGGQQAVPLGKWTLIRANLTHSTTAGAFPQLPGARIANPSAAGSYLITNAFVIDTPYDGRFVCADMPGWRTLPDGSSAGYPYTLESIAGRPLAINTMPNSQSAAFNLPPLAGRTLYVVHRTIVAATVIQPLGAIGVPPDSNGATGGLSYRTRGSSGATQTEARVANNGGGAVVFRPGPAGARVAGQRAVGCVWLADGVGSVGISVGNSADVVSALDVGAGQREATYLALSAATVNEEPEAAYAFLGEHNRATREAVTRWLANAYGAPLAA